MFGFFNVYERMGLEFFVLSGFFSRTDFFWRDRIYFCWVYCLMRECLFARESFFFLTGRHIYCCVISVVLFLLLTSSWFFLTGLFFYFFVGACDYCCVVFRWYSSCADCWVSLFCARGLFFYFFFGVRVVIALILMHSDIHSFLHSFINLWTRHGARVDDRPVLDIHRIDLHNDLFERVYV